MLTLLWVCPACETLNAWTQQACTECGLFIDTYLLSGSDEVQSAEFWGRRGIKDALFFTMLSSVNMRRS